MSQYVPRLTWDQLDPTLADMLSARVKRLGYLGEFFRVLGHQPRALRGFVEFTEAAKSGLDKRLVELLALTVASHFGNAYERNQHERLSVRSGFGRPWIEAVESLEPRTAPGLNHLERSVQAFALISVRSHGRDGQGEFDTLVQKLGVAQSIAALMIISRYVAHAYLANVFRLAPPVPAIWEDGFTG